MTQFTSERSHEGSYLVYLNGIEVPASRVQVSMGVGEKPAARIFFPPDEDLVRLGAEDRVGVAVFYLDDMYTEVQGRSPDFRLLFEGEITGYSYTKSKKGRTLVFNCINHINILDDLDPSFVTGLRAEAMRALSPPQGNEVVSTQMPSLLPWSLFFYGFPGNQQVVRRPFDFLQNILRACVGADEQKKLASVVTTNFHARYMRRTGFVNRFIPSPLIETDILAAPASEAAGVFPLLKAVQDTKAIDVLLKRAAQMGTGSSIWNTLQNMFVSMYYEILCITTAPIAKVNMAPGHRNNGTILGPPEFKTKSQIKAEQDALEVEALRIAREQAEREIARREIGIGRGATFPSAEARQLELDERISVLVQEFLAAGGPINPLAPNKILNYITKPQWLFGIPPSCNVVFPSMVDEIKYTENYRQPTRLYVNDLWAAETFGGNDEVKNAMATLRFGYPDQVQHELDKRSGNSSISGRNFLVWPEEFYRGPMCTQTTLPDWYTFIEQDLRSNQTDEEKRANQALLLIKQSTDPEIDVLKILHETGALEESVTTIADAERILEKRTLLLDAGRKRLRRAFARYEYLRQRSSQRNGAVIMTFDPYKIPGFPMPFFDDLSTGQHFYGYVATVAHDLSPGHLGTTIGFIHAQTLDELMHEVFDARAGNKIDGIQADASAAPLYPIASLRDVIQNMDRAEDYFTLLFHQKQEYGGKRVKRNAFDFQEAVRLVMPKGKPREYKDAFDDPEVKKAIAHREQEEAGERRVAARELEQGKAAIREDVTMNPGKWGLEPTTVEEVTPPLAGRRDVEDVIAEEYAKLEKYHEERLEEARFRRQMLNPIPRIISDVLQKYTGITPSEKFAPMFSSHAQAMRFVSRPICTLEEYINFQGKWGTRIGPVSSTDPVQGKGALFYTKILNLKQGPGPAPTFDENNNLVTPAANELPDTRADWETRLLRYRRKALRKKMGLGV